MLDTWFLEDIQAGLQRVDRFVIIDEQRQCGPLLDAVRKRLPGTLFEAGSAVEALQVKYRVEKEFQRRPVVIVTTIPLDRLTFLREYCETGGRLHITYLHRYILHTVSQRLHIDLGARPAADILALGLLSLGKHDDFWLRVAYGELFTVDDVLGFLKNPPHHVKTFGPEGLRLFCEYWSKFTPYPLTGKPPQTIADEFSAALFGNMLSPNRLPLLEQIYHTWIDSKTYEKALFRYLEKYTEPYGADIWNVPVDHPLARLDKRQLHDVIAHLREHDWIQGKLPRLQERAGQAVVKVLGISYWQDLVTLLRDDAAHTPAIGSLNDAVTHYGAHLHKVDNAFRHLYTGFMTEKEIVAPLQDYYRSLIQPFLDAWRTYFPGQYHENQTGLLQRLLTDYAPPVAIIVGDAISYEIAEEIARGIESDYRIDHQFACANYPSETINNMTSLFSTAGDLLSTREKRENALLESVSQPDTATFLNLDDLSPAHEAAGYTILYSADVDQLSEKQQQHALKYYAEFISTVQQKIKTLFDSGYRHVFLVSDHGFVLTGELSEPDKIAFDVPEGQKAERYCLSQTKVRPLPTHILEFERPYKGYTYLYCSTTLNPFKTKGAYGFAHGGITPQEVLIPCLHLQPYAGSVPELPVIILNKPALRAVVGNTYAVKLKAGETEGELFAHERKIMLVCLKGTQELTKTDIITIKAGETITKEFQFGQKSEFDMMIRDANTQKRLDSCVVKRQQARDLGGLGL